MLTARVVVTKVVITGRLSCGAYRKRGFHGVVITGCLSHGGYHRVVITGVATTGGYHRVFAT